jgi:hypothetical protein
VIASHPVSVLTKKGAVALFLLIIIRNGNFPRLSGISLPITPILQIENKHLASQGFFVFFVNLLKASFQRFPQEQKLPYGGVCFLLDCGAGRTIIEPPGGGPAKTYKL